MVFIRTFWTPCYYYDDIRTATTTIAFYTAMSSLIAIAYTSYVMRGGESSNYYMPYFETDIRFSTQVAGGLAIVFFLAFILFSFTMYRGIAIENRGFMLPWIGWILIVIGYQFYYGISVLFMYYIYLESVMITLVSWIWMSYNIYCLICVYSQYQVIRDKQQPHLIYEY